MIIFLGENEDKKLPYIGLGSGLLDMMPKPQIAIEKRVHWNIKNFDWK